MKVFKSEDVKKCLAEVVGEDKIYALALLEWAIDKKTFDIEIPDESAIKGGSSCTIQNINV